MDQDYTDQAAAEAAQSHSIRLEEVKHSMAKRGFVLLPLATQVGGGKKLRLGRALPPTSALMPQLFAQVDIRRGMRSLNYLLDIPITGPEAADLFCQDLYKDFDIDQLVMMVKPARIHQEYLAVAKE